eukprot:356851-Chlamydomonas_euryale.AAC.4
MPACEGPQQQRPHVLDVAAAAGLAAQGHLGQARRARRICGQLLQRHQAMAEAHLIRGAGGGKVLAVGVFFWTSIVQIIWLRPHSLVCTYLCGLNRRWVWQRTAT